MLSLERVRVNETNFEVEVFRCLFGECFFQSSEQVRTLEDNVQCINKRLCYAKKWWSHLQKNANNQSYDGVQRTSHKWFSLFFVGEFRKQMERGDYGSSSWPIVRPPDVQRLLWQSRNPRGKLHRTEVREKNFSDIFISIVSGGFSMHEEIFRS